MKRNVSILVASVVFLTACADKSKDIHGTYVSPIAYQNYSCSQLTAEARRISRRANEIAGIQDNNAQNDAVATGVALVLFWPAAFFIRGNKENRAELARLKGELDAIEAVSIRKNCNIRFSAKAA